MRIYFIILFSLVSLNLNAWDKINYLGSDNIGCGGAIAADVGDIDNVIVNPASAFFSKNKKVDIKLSGMKLFSEFDAGLYNYSIAGGYDFGSLTLSGFYGSFISDMYSESVFGIGSSKMILKNFVVGLSFILELNSFNLTTDDSDILFSGVSLSENNWYFNPGILYIVNENLTIGLYSSELFGKDFNFGESILGIGIKNLVYENSKSFLSRIILKLDVYTIGGIYQNFKTGLEFYLLKKYLQLRVGYNRNNISFGTGFTYNRYALNFAYLLYNKVENFGNTAKASIEVKF